MLLSNHLSNHWARCRTSNPTFLNEKIHVEQKVDNLILSFVYLVILFFSPFDSCFFEPKPDLKSLSKFHFILRLCAAQLEPSTSPRAYTGHLTKTVKFSFLCFCRRKNSGDCNRLITVPFCTTCRVLSNKNARREIK